MPTLTWLDSFEHQVAAQTAYGTNSGVYDTITGASGMSFVTGRRTGSHALQIAQDGVTAGRAAKTIPAGSRVLVESFYFKSSAKPSVDSIFWSGAANSNGSLQILAGSGFMSIRAVNAGTPVTVSTDFTDGVWRRIDLKWNTSASPYTLDVSIDGAAQTQATAGGAASDITAAGLGSTVTTHTLTAAYQDWVRSVTSGDHPIGDHICVPLIPNADGSHNWASTNMGDETGGRASSITDLNTKVAEFPPNTTDFIAYTNVAATGTEYAEILLPDVGSGATVWAARAVAAIFSSGTAANGATTRVVDGSGTTVLDLYVGDQSDTSNRYQAALLSGVDTPSEVNALKWRVGFPTDSSPAPRWSALMVDVAIPGDGSGTATPAAVAGVGAVPSPTGKGNGNTTTANVVGSNVLTGADDNTGSGDSFATSSYAFENGIYYLMTVATRGGTATTPAVSGGGITWNNQVGSNIGSPSMGIFVFSGYAASGATTGALTITTFDTPTAIKWSLGRWTGLDHGAFFEINRLTAGTGATGTGSVSAGSTFQPAYDATWAAYVHGATEAHTPDTGFTLLSDELTALTPNMSLGVEYLVGEDTVPTMTWATTTVPWRGIALWLIADVAKTTFPVAGRGRVPAATAVGGGAVNGTASPAAVAGVGAIPAPTAKGDSTASPAATAGVGAVPAATATGNGTASPAAVAGVGAVPASTAKGNGTAAPAAVAGVGAVSAPTGKGDASTVVVLGAAPGVSNTGEGGVPGDTVNVTNSDDDGQGTAWDEVVVLSNSTVTYDDHGAIGKSIKVAKTLTDNDFVGWDASLADGNTQYGRMYVLFDTLPSANSQVIAIYRTAAGTNQGRLRIDASGTISVTDASPTQQGVSASPLSTGTLYRLEWQFVRSATAGSWVVNIYAGHNTSPIETVTTATNLNTGAATTQVIRYGTNGGIAGTFTYWAKWFNGNQSAFPGPVLAGTTTVVGTGAVPAATASGAVPATATPAVVAGVGAVPAPTASGNATASPGAVAGVGAVPAPTVTGTATATPAATASVGTVPAPTAIGGGASTATPAQVAGVSAVPAPTAKGDGSTSTPATAPGISNTGEGGNSGNTVSTTNSDDDGQGTAWDAVAIAATSTITYDDHGAIGKSIKVAKASGDTNTLDWNATLPNGTTQYGRMYLLFDVAPASQAQILVNYRNNPDTSAVGAIRLNPTSKLIATNASGTTVATSSMTFATGTLYRLEWKLFTDLAAGTWEVRIYQGHSTTLLETLNATALNTGSAAGIVRFGTNGTQTGAFTYWAKWFDTNQTAFPGPAVIGTTTVVGVGAVPAAVANGNATGLPAVTVGIGMVPAPAANGTATASPAVVVGTGAVPAPQATGAATATPAATSGVGAVPAPSASGSAPATVSPATVAGTGSVPAPTLIGAATATPGVVAGTGNVQSPTSYANPATVAGIGAVPSATASGSAFAAPATVVGIGAVPAPTATGNATALPAATAGTGSVPPATAKGNATAVPAATAGVGSVPAPTGSVFVTASPTATVGVGSVPAPTATGAAKGVAAAVVGVGAVPAPTAKGNATASPAVTVGVGSVPAPTASGATSATATPARVAGVGSVPAPAVLGSAVAYPQGLVDPFTGEFSEEFGELQDAPTQALGSVPAPTTTGTSVATPDVVAGTVVGSGAFDGGFDGNYDTGVFPDAIAHGNATALPVRVAGVGSVPPAAAPGGATALPAVTAGVGSVPPATATGAAFASPPAVVGIGSVPPVVASGLAFAHPSVTAGIGSVPAATANGGAAAIGLPGSVAGVGTVPAPAGSGSATASPTPVAGVGAVPAPTATGATAAQPAATAGVGAVPPSTAKGNATAAPAATAGVGAVPPVTAFARATALPAATVGIGSVPPSVASGAAFASPGAVPGIGSVPVTTAAGGSVGTATPASVAGIGSVPAPVASGLATAAPIATAGTGAVPPATARGSSTAQPASTVGVGSVPAPTATGTAFASPAVTAGVGSVPPSTAVATAKATPAVNAGVGGVPAPTATGGASSTATPAATAGVGSVPAASASGGAFAKPAATSGVGSVPPATAHGAAVATSTQVAGVGSVPQSSPDSQARALPAAVAGVGLVPPTIGRGAATASPATVTTVGSIPAPSAFGGVASTATPVSVAGIGSVPAPTATVTIRAFPPRVAGVGAVPASTQTGAGRALPIAAFAIGLVPIPEVIGANANTATPMVVEGIGRVPAANAHGQGPAEPQHDYSPGHQPSPIVGTPRPGWRGQPVGAGISASANGGTTGSGNAQRYTGRADPEGSA